jgi:hypothetical protein
VDRFSPNVTISEADGLVRLGLDGVSSVEGETLQDAADALVCRLLVIAMAYRSSGAGPINAECGVDPALMEFIWELGEIAASGRDIRERLFGHGLAA